MAAASSSTRGPSRGPSAPIDREHVVDGPIAIVPSYGDADPDLIDWHLGRGARGIVIEGTGAGNVNAALVPGIERARDRNVPVVITSRCTTGTRRADLRRPRRRPLDRRRWASSKAAT